jgi:uncharacterized membrane protein
MNTPLRNEQRVAILFLLCLPVLLTLLLWAQLPAEIPIHWNWRGEVDGYASKLYFLLYQVGLGAFIFFAFDVLPRLDPKRANYERFGRAYGVMAVAIAGFLSFVTLMSLAVALGYEVSMARVIPVGVSLLLAIIGNNLINVKPNYFVGIRTPWTLESEYVWRKTHRLGGQLWFYGGLLLMLLCLFLAPGGTLLALLVGVAVLALVPVIYSYWLYHQNDGKDLV